MLHFPSKNTAAHTASPADVAQLHRTLDDHVWAFSNCRVDTPGCPVAEVDWLFFNSVKGTFILNEWKRYPAAVALVRDTGEPWILTNGSEVSNPVEQVSRQLEAVRRALQLKMAPLHFPTRDPYEVNPYPSVYSPQVGPATRKERLRYCAVHGSLEGIAETVEERWSPTPHVPAEGTGTLQLAETLAEVFRCSISSTVRRKLAPPPPERPDPAARIAAIHREMAALHCELASLLESPGFQATPVAAMPAAVPPSPRAAKALAPAPPSARVPAPAPAPIPASPSSTRIRSVTAPAKKGHLQHHVAKHVPLSKATAQHIRVAFLAALQDGQLRHSGVHIGLFGSLVGQRLKGDSSLADLAPGSLRKWCLAQAAAAGIAASIDTLDPSIVRIKG